MFVFSKPACSYYFRQNVYDGSRDRAYLIPGEKVREYNA